MVAASTSPLNARIIAIDGQPLLRWALRQLISGVPNLEFVGDASTVQDALALVERAQPTLAVLGLDYSDGTGFGLIKDLRIRFPGLPTLIYATQEGNAYAEHCLGLGARGYVSSSQSPEELLTAIQAVLKGDLYLRSDRHIAILARLVATGGDAAKPLTERLSASEFEVFHLVGNGLSNQEIAAKLHRSIKTVETYRARIKEKLGIGNSVELAQFALRCLNENQKTFEGAGESTGSENSADEIVGEGAGHEPLRSQFVTARQPAGEATSAAPSRSKTLGSETSRSKTLGSETSGGETSGGELPRSVTSKIATPHILIVDDHSISRDPLAIILRQNGFKTDCARDGNEAIEKIVEHDPSLVLLDLLMPQMNGIRVLQFIRETPRYRKTPVIVMTALTGGELIDQSRALGAQIIFKAETRIDELINSISRTVQAALPHIAAAG